MRRPNYPLRYASIVAVLWAKEVAGPLMAVVGLVLNLVASFVLEPGVAQSYAWMKGIGVAVLCGSVVCVFVATFNAWNDERIKTEVETRPRLILTDAPVECVPFPINATVYGMTESITTRVGDGFAFRMRVENKPIGRHESCAAKNVVARVGFFDPSGNRIFEMDGRWAESTEFANRDTSKDYLTELLPVSFPICTARSLDIACRVNGRDECMGLNNDNWRYGHTLEVPGRPVLNGTVSVVVSLDGLHVSYTIKFKLDTKELKLVGVPSLVDNLHG